MNLKSMAVLVASFGIVGSAFADPQRNAAANLELQAAVTRATTTISLLESRIAGLEKKLALLEAAVGTLDKTSANHTDALGKAKAQLGAFYNHTHDVVIYGIDHKVATVKDTAGQEKQVVIPGPVFGNPKGETGKAKVPASAPF
jgi:uncharacterized coiled-coil protein SlyX